LLLNGVVSEHLELVHDATQNLVQTVDGLTDSQWAEPSLLPGWTRAHVIAHLTLNAHGMIDAVEGQRQGKPIPMYASDASRDSDINELATVDPDKVRERFFASTTALRDHLEALTPALGVRVVERTPGGPTFALNELVTMRWREVEIHHADLGSAFTQRDWSPEFARYLLGVAAWDRGADQDLRLHTPDGEVSVGAGTGAVISGSAADLGWWLVGRGSGDGLSGDLPTLGPWLRRTPAK
jgi:maleylpyruvate isomerase